VGAVLALAAVVLGACGSGDTGGDAGAGDEPIVIAGTPLSTTDIVMTMALGGKVPEKHGVALAFERVRTVSVLYQDFTAGRYDCILTDPAVFVEQAAQGLPVTVLAAVSPNFAYLIARKDAGIDDPGDLVGKRLVAATAGTRCSPRWRRNGTAST
jgi:ABC-type nitrate/sulfonate/bicarbonate transport system substrate-binding protein